MPSIVACGKQPNVWACGLCHYPNGKGRSENAGVSRLSVEYFINTLNDFKNGTRSQRLFAIASGGLLKQAAH